MAGLVPAIHVFTQDLDGPEKMDSRIKSGHDDVWGVSLGGSVGESARQAIQSRFRAG